jgi:hypothetical protein
MRLLILLLLVSCSSSVPLKYKYTSSKHYLASLTSDDVIVHRIEGKLKKEVLFASGMDSTFLIVELYDKEGSLLTDVDPNDLTLSTSEDVEAKPFVLKQGVFKAQIQPRVKSKSIVIRVDWKEKVLSPEIFLKTTTAPLKDSLEPVPHEFFQTKTDGEIDVSRGSKTPETATDGFAIHNIGDNKIVDASKNKHSERVFHFDYLEQAKQNITLELDDAPNDKVSQTMHSVFMFFPRKNLPMVEQLTGTINVTLPTGEKVIFQKDSKEIVDGVISEGPVDSSKDKIKREFPRLKYLGKGIVLRANARGQAPQLGQFGNEKIDLELGLKGSVDVLIINGTTGQRCRRPKADFWEPLDVVPVEFKFVNDGEFDLYLKDKCGFGIPKLN